MAPDDEAIQALNYPVSTDIPYSAIGQMTQFDEARDNFEPQIVTHPPNTCLATPSCPYLLDPTTRRYWVVVVFPGGLRPVPESGEQAQSTPGNPSANQLFVDPEGFVHQVQQFPATPQRPNLIPLDSFIEVAPLVFELQMDIASGPPEWLQVQFLNDSACRLETL